MFAVSCAEFNTCHAHAQCNYITSQQRHKCQCNPGYEGDGYECSIIGEYFYIPFFGSVILYCTYIQSKSKSICIL